MKVYKTKEEALSDKELKYEEEFILSPLVNSHPSSWRKMTKKDMVEVRIMSEGEWALNARMLGITPNDYEAAYNNYVEMTIRHNAYLREQYLKK